MHPLTRRSAFLATAGAAALLQGCAQTASGDGIRRDARYKYAEAGGHHDVMLLDAPRFVDALLALG